MTVNKTLEDFDALDIEEQKLVLDIIKKRVSEQRRQEILDEYEEAKKDIEQGKLEPETIDELFSRLDI